MKKTLALALALLAAAPSGAWAAIGCTLSNPAEDLKYLFPEMTSYREELEELTKLPDGKAAFAGLPARIGGKLDPIYETYETPYTVYAVFAGKKKIGVVHGVNVPGQGGVIQVFLAADPTTAAIQKFFFQRLESPAAKPLRDKAFRAKFEGLTLADFYKHDYYAVVPPADASNETDRVALIGEPKGLGADGRADYEASLRGIRKNLVLLDIFVYGRRFEPYFERAREATAKAAAPEVKK